MTARSPYELVVMFIVFMIPVSVMLEVVYELRTFSDTMITSEANQSAMEKDIKIMLNNTQAIVIASVKNLNEMSTERRMQFDTLVNNQIQIMRHEERIISNQKEIMMHWGLPYPSRPTPLLSEKQ